MKKLLFTLLIVPCLAFTSLSPNTDVTDANKALFNALLNKDASTLEGLLDSDCTLIMVDGSTYDRETVLTGVKGGYATFDESNVESASVKMLNSDVAVVLGTWKTKGQIQGNNFDYRAFYSTIFIKRGNGWKVSQAQFTITK